MFTLLLLTTGATLGYLCSVAGFLVIVASVMFVIKGKAVLGDSASQQIEWGKMKANLTSSVALFFLGAGLIALPFWSVAQAEAKHAPTAVLTGKITGAENRDIRLLLVAKPDYDQSYSGTISWQFPFLADKLSYSVFYIDGGTVIHQEAFTLKPVEPGSPPQMITLPAMNLQTGKPITENVSPKLEVSNEYLKNLGVH